MSEVHIWRLQQLSTKRRSQGVRGSLLIKPGFIPTRVHVSPKIGGSIVKLSWDGMCNQTGKRYSVRDLGRDSPVLCLQNASMMCLLESNSLER